MASTSEKPVARGGAVTCASLVVLALVAAAPSAVAQSRASDCTEGVWELQTTNAGAAGPAAATSTRYCLFDGLLEMAEYRSFAQNGRLTFAGISFHAHGDVPDMMTTLWLMIGDPGYTILPSHVDAEGRQIANGFGVDHAGTFLERSVTVLAGNNDYKFEMERSYDDGRTWQPAANIDGTYRGSSVPAHPTALQVPYQGMRGPKPATVGVIVLDGMAEVDTSSVVRNGTPVRTIQFSSAYRVPPDSGTGGLVWRTITWGLGDTTFVTTHRPAPQLQK